MSREAMKPVAWTDEDFTQLIVSEDIAKDIGATVPLYAAPPETAELLREIAELSANALDDYKMIQSLMAERALEPVAWRNAAMRLGEDLCSVGPFGYYDMTAEQWLDWALSVVTVHAPPPKREPPCKTGSQCTTKCMECAEPEPVAWLITDEKINSIQVDSIQRLIDRAKHAHMTDIKLRINGQDEWYQADWLKHMTRTSPTKPEPVAWAISFDGETPYKLWDGGDCALLDIEVKRHGGKTRKMPLYTAPPKREPEPVIDKSAAIRIATSLGWTPQRKPLTKEQVWQAYMEISAVFDCNEIDLVEFARAIEAAHGIKGEDHGTR